MFLCRSRKEFAKRALKPPYRCDTHGKYREYNDYLVGLKNWCILWVTIISIFLTLALNQLKVLLQLSFYFYFFIFFYFFFFIYLFIYFFFFGGGGGGGALIPLFRCQIW